MSKEVFKQQFEAAKRLYVERHYEEALASLTEINEKYPDIFNVRFPMLQCLQRLGRFEEAREIYDRLRESYTDEKHLAKLRKAEKRLAAAESKSVPEPSQTGDSDDLQDTPAEDIGDLPQEAPVVTKTPSRFSRLPAPVRAVLISLEIIVILAVVFLGMNMLITKLDEAPSFKSDIVMELHDARFNGKLYFKSPHRNRTEIMEEMFVASDGRVHRLIPDEGQYFKSSVADMIRYNPLFGVGDIAEWSRRNDAVRIGRETVQGFVCDVYEAQTESDDPDVPTLSRKVWYARRLRFPIRSEIVLPEQKGRMTVSLENIQTGHIPDALFVIPSGYAEVQGRREARKTSEEISALPSNLDPLLEALNQQLLLDNIKTQE